ncbi:MAG TPA: hypothetical protein VI197_06725 [Polyangiaceae bacterium]
MNRWFLLSWIFACGCSRDAEIYDEPETFVPPPMPTQRETPSVPNLDLEDFPACSARPEGDCRGVNDFPCAFTDHARDVIEACFLSTDCRADGWVSVELGDDGCLSDIGMESLEAAFAECLREALGPIQCPCGASEYSVFLGVENEACRDDSGPPG